MTHLVLVVDDDSAALLPREPAGPRGRLSGMAINDLPRSRPKKPSPLVLMGIGLVPLLAVIGWHLFAVALT
jgi:hypothetical protein